MERADSRGGRVVANADRLAPPRLAARLDARPGRLPVDGTVGEGDTPVRVLLPLALWLRAMR